MKSRGVYETPGGTILMEAHRQLEELVLDRDTYEAKKDMGNKTGSDRLRRKMVHSAARSSPGICRMPHSNM